MNDPLWPWAHFNSIAEHWQAQPSFVVGQLLFMACALFAAVHALRTSRENKLIWLGALVAGTANDFIFMALPLVDNFWQAQGLVMLTPRMPLYIPCVYVCFMYFPTVAVRALRLDRTRTIVLAGLAAMLFYAPYDIVGAKFLWWTWHDTDAPIAARILGAPCSSSLWVLTFVGAFSFWIDQTMRPILASGRAIEGRDFALGLAKIAGLTTLTMMVQMTVLQMLDGGAPAYRALAAGVGVYAGLAVRGAFAADGPRTQRFIAVPPVLGVVLAYLLCLASIGASFDPQTHISTGVHQERGTCYVEQTDITRQTRFQYLCETDYDESYTLDCPAVEGYESASWYTVCGKEDPRQSAWAAKLAMLCALTAALFIGILTRRPVVV